MLRLPIHHINVVFVLYVPSVQILKKVGGDSQVSYASVACRIAVVYW